MILTRTSLFSGITALLLAGTTIAQQKIDVPPPHKIYHGVSVGNADDLQNKVDKYLAAVTGADRPFRTSLAWVYFHSELDPNKKNAGFPSELCEVIFTQYGAIPYIRLFLRTDTKSESKGELSFDDILEGDILKQKTANLVKEWGEAAGAWGKPLLVEWGSECNAVWSPWNSSPEKFKKTHISIVSKAGRSNISWVFHIDASEKEARDFTEFYPGNDVDWIGVSVYGIPQRT